uniref:ATP synthase F(0) complex subunit e, mitochondrial n=1 Tax=Mus spicilegus TaxID=10103 RepID=A0A8C6GZF9_MUSSI
MVPPVQVSPLIKRGQYSALVPGLAYSYLKPLGRRKDELKQTETEMAEAQDHRHILFLRVSYFDSVYM